MLWLLQQNLTGVDEKPWQNCDFGKFKTGRIGIQDHPGVISFRNIKILEL